MVNSLYLDPVQRAMVINGTPCRLSNEQYRFVFALYEYCGLPVNRADLISFIWPDSVDICDDRALDAIAQRVRRSIAKIVDPYSVIITVRGYGFRMDSHPQWLSPPDITNLTPQTVRQIAVFMHRAIDKWQELSISASMC
jgi:DNA-binding response OmpR family regulator